MSSARRSMSAGAPQRRPNGTAVATPRRNDHGAPPPVVRPLNFAAAKRRDDGHPAPASARQNRRAAAANKRDESDSGDDDVASSDPATALKAAADELDFLAEKLLDEQDANARLRARVKELEAQSASVAARQRQWPSFNFRQLMVERQKHLSVMHELETCLCDAATRECAQFIPETMLLECDRQKEERSRLVASTVRRLRGWCFTFSDPSERDALASTFAAVEDEPAAFLHSFQGLRAACNNFAPPPADPGKFARTLNESERLMLLRALQAIVVSYDISPDEVESKHPDALLDLARHEPFLSELGRELTGQGTDPLIPDEILPAPARVLRRPASLAPPPPLSTSSTAATPRVGRAAASHVFGTPRNRTAASSTASGGRAGSTSRPALAATRARSKQPPQTAVTATDPWERLVTGAQQQQVQQQPPRRASSSAGRRARFDPSVQ